MCNAPFQILTIIPPKLKTPPTSKIVVYLCIHFSNKITHSAVLKTHKSVQALHSVFFTVSPILKVQKRKTSCYEKTPSKFWVFMTISGKMRRSFNFVLILGSCSNKQQKFKVFIAPLSIEEIFTQTSNYFLFRPSSKLRKFLK